MQSSRINTESKEKKTYHSPVFEEIGDIKDLTQTNAPPPFTGNDGGSFPNMYAS